MLAVVKHVKETEAPVGTDNVSSRIWTMKNEISGNWTLNKMFTFTDNALPQLNWDGPVEPRLSYTEMYVNVTVKGDNVVFVIDQIREKCTKGRV